MVHFMRIVSQKKRKKPRLRSSGPPAAQSPIQPSLFPSIRWEQKLPVLHRSGY